MTRAIVLVASAVAGCIDNDPITVDDVIVKLDVVDGTAIADGHSKIGVEICTQATRALDPKLTATLVTSAGTWAIPGTVATSTTVTMSSPCEDAPLVVPNDPSTFFVTATIGSFAKTLPITLAPAPIDGILLKRDGTLSTTDASSFTITANLLVANGGHPSRGTLVEFAATPTLGKVYFNQPAVVLQQGDSVQSMLFASAGTTDISVVVTATPPGGAATTSGLRISF
jgi:hypothetical protein